MEELDGVIFDKISVVEDTEQYPYFLLDPVTHVCPDGQLFATVVCFMFCPLFSPV